MQFLSFFGHRNLQFLHFSRLRKEARSVDRFTLVGVGNICARGALIYDHSFPMSATTTCYGSINEFPFQGFVERPLWQCGGALEHSNTRECQIALLSESLPTHKLFIYWTHMLRSCQQHVRSALSFKLHSFSLRFLPAILHILESFFKSKNFYTKRSSLAKQQQSWKPFLNGPRKDLFVSFLTIFSVRFFETRRNSLSFSSRPLFAI